MFLSQFRRLAWRLMGRPARRVRPQVCVRPRLQLHALLLEERAVPAVIANPDPAAGHEAAYWTGVNQTLIVQPADGVLINDVGTNLSVLDVDGDAENGIQVTEAPSYGTLSMHANGSFVYIPSSGFEGIDGFSYRATDGTSSSAPTTVTIIISSAPLARSQVLQTNEDTSASGTVTAQSSNGSPLTFALVNGSAVGGTAQVNSDGSFTFTPNQNFTG